MYTATMDYPVKKGKEDEFIGIWDSEVLSLAKERDGFIRMQLLKTSGRLLAIGTWKDQSYAEAFMQTGVFKELLAQLGPLLEGDPKPTIWNQVLFSEACFN